MKVFLLSWIRQLEIYFLYLYIFIFIKFFFVCSISKIRPYKLRANNSYQYYIDEFLAFVEMKNNKKKYQEYIFLLKLKITYHLKDNPYIIILKIYL